jgi:menaquinone-dependent protoporphyrinogen oxidase
MNGFTFEKNKHMKILVVYGTTEGQTRKIARYMENELVTAGHSVTLTDASDAPLKPQGFDAVIIGASIHVQKYQSAVTHYISENAVALNAMPCAFFSVSLAIASEFEEEHLAIKKITTDYLAATGWRPVMVTQIAGALKYTEYDYFKRLIMKMISKKEGRTTDTSRDHEFTDWNAVKAFTLEFEAKAAPVRA